MCLGCWDEAGRPFKVTDAVTKWVPEFRETDGFGPLHIVVEDWNLDDYCIGFCKKQADASPEEIALLDALTAMTEEERWATAILAQYPGFDPATIGQLG